jgi:hypothetical protein
MSKIKLTEIVKETLQKAQNKARIRKEMDSYVQKMSSGIEKLKTLMRRDGYDV